MHINNRDRILAIAAICLAIFAIVEIRSARTTTGVLSAVASAMSLSAIVHRRWQETQPPFTHLEVDKTLNFPNASPELAQLSTTLKSKANYDGIGQIWFRNINADGQIANIRVNGGEPSTTQRKAGSWEVSTEFPRVLRRGEVVTVQLTYDLQNSFPSEREGVTHLIVTKTNDLRVHVRFHPAKVPRRVRAFVEYASAVQEFLDALTVDDKRTHVNLHMATARGLLHCRVGLVTACYASPITPMHISGLVRSNITYTCKIVLSREKMHNRPIFAPRF